MRLLLLLDRRWSTNTSKYAPIKKQAIPLIVHPFLVLF